MRSFVVSAFSSDSLQGNPAAVVLLERSFHAEHDKGKHLAIAREFNLSETAFVVLPSKPEDSASWLAPVDLRWFTPTTEVDLCGHATLATAHVLFTSFLCISGPITFSTRSGNLVVSKSGGAESNRYEMKFPYNMPVLLDMSALPTPVSQIVAAVFAENGEKAFSNSTSSVVPLAVDALIRIRMKGIAYSARTRKLILHLKDEEAPILAKLTPDFDALLGIDQSALPPDQRVTGVSVAVATATAAAPSNSSSLSCSSRDSFVVETADFSSRYFTPWNGINEDPVNGSSHTILGPYFATILSRFSPSATDCCTMSPCTVKMASITAIQASARGGVLFLKVCEHHHSAAGSSEEVAAASPSVDCNASFVMIGGAARLCRLEDSVGSSPMLCLGKRCGCRNPISALEPTGQLGLCDACVVSLKETDVLLSLAVAYPRPRRPSLALEYFHNLTEALEEIADDSAFAASAAQELGIDELFPIKADGNCLFSAAADQLWGDTGRHQQVRAAAAAYVAAHPELASIEDRVWKGGPRDAAEYAADMLRTDGGARTYGGPPEMRAFVEIYGRPVKLIERLEQGRYRVVDEFQGAPERSAPQIVIIKEVKPHFSSGRGKHWLSNLLK